MKYLFLTFLTATIFLGQQVKAQSLQNLGGETENVIIETVPEKPSPGELVSASIISYALDLDRAEISWFLNGTLSQKAVGRKKFSFRVGKIGTVTEILIIIKTADGGIIQKSRSFRPASLDLAWEADSYIPPFYKGKALYPYQGTIKVVALPDFVTENGGTINEKNLIYNWKIDDKAKPERSGLGKNFIYFTGSIPLKPVSVEVEVTSFDQSIIATDSITVSPSLPGILFYEVSPIYGLLQNQVVYGSVALKDEELKLSAMPYYFSLKGGALPDLSYSWLLDGKVLGNKNRTITFRQEKDSEGTAGISLNLKHPSKIFQFASAVLNLEFGKSSALNQISF